MSRIRSRPDDGVVYILEIILKGFVSTSASSEKLGILEDPPQFAHSELRADPQIL